MGLSLRNLTKKIGDVVGGVERQINPFDNGATYSNPNPAPRPTAPVQNPVLSRPQPFRVGQIQLRPGVGPGQTISPNPMISNPAPSANDPVTNFLKPIGQAVGGLAQTAVTPFVLSGKALYEAGPRTIAATVTGNKIAAQNAQKAMQTTENQTKNFVKGVVQFIPRSAVQVGASLPTSGALNRQIRPVNPTEKFLLGDQPVQSLQNVYRTNAVQGGSASGVGNVVANAGGDILAGVGAKVGAKATVKLVKPRAPINEIGAVGKNVKPNIPTEPPDFLKTSPDYKGVKPRELTDLSPKEQLALTQPPTPLAPHDVNTAKNPFKAQIPIVKPRDYGQVIANEQAASLPTKFAGDRWIASMQKLNPDEQANFWRAVEKPNDKNYSPQLTQAISAWREVDNRIHGTSQALGGNTNYLQDHALHPWNLPPEFTEHIVNGGDPSKFPGLNSISRKYRTIEEGEANGLQLGNDPISEGQNYINASSALLKRRAIMKGIAEADREADKTPHNFSLGAGAQNNIAISNEARNALRGLQRSSASTSKVVKGLRTANVGLKSSILSLGQFHPINISLLRAAPTLALEGHPVAAIKGATKTFAALTPRYGNKMVENTLNRAIQDGMVDKAAKIGMPYGTGGFDAEGSFVKGGVGHKTVFGKQMPMMHDQVVRSIVHDLEKKGISLDSPEARIAGQAGNNLMGFVNAETQKIPPQVNRSLGDFLLAKQFTHSKFSQTKTALTKGGVGGSYARANVIANVAATTALITGLGYLGKQKSDDLRDLLLRALVDPAAPTSTKDSKGNTTKLRTPGTDTSDIAKLLGIKLVRQKDGHLGISWKPDNMPQTVTDFARARLSPFASSGVKVATNTTFAGKPLYDPNAPTGTKVEQGATSVITGNLPIGLQGLPMTSAVEKHLPQNVQDVLNAQKPGSNPLTKSIGSSFGVTPTTDTTVGKAKESSQYFDAVNQFSKGLDRQSKDAYDLWVGSKKNPVTGKYDVQPNVNDARTKASALLQNPKALNNLIALNQSLSKKGQKTDPLWGMNKDQIISYLQYQAMPPGSADKTDWWNKNQSWYSPLVDARNAFFDSLPKGDPNKPKLDLQYPQPNSQVQQSMDAYSNLTDAKQKSAFLDAHPEIIKQWNAQANYTNKLREALGYSPLKNYPEASPQLQSFMDKYNSADKATRKAIRNSNPQAYQNMIAYFDSLDLYNIGKQASVSQLQGEPDYTSKEAKAISSLGKDIYQNPDGTYSIVPAGWMQGLSNGSGGSSGGYSGRKYVSRSAARLQNPYAFAVDSDAGGKHYIGKVNAKPPKPGFYQAKLSPKRSISVKGKPKVSSKKSMV